VAGTSAEFASRFDLATFAYVAAKSRDVLVIDVADVVDAKGANLAAWGEASASTAAAAARTTGAGTAAFATPVAIATVTWCLGATEPGALRAITTLASVSAIFTVIGAAALAALSFFSHDVKCFLCESESET